MPFLQRTNPSVDWERRTVSFDKISATPAVTTNAFAPLPCDANLHGSGKTLFATVDENVFDYQTRSKKKGKVLFDPEVVALHDASCVGGFDQCFTNGMAAISAGCKL